jgi:hypothetical protein
MDMDGTGATAQTAPAGVFYDGTSNRRRQVQLRVADRLEIVEDGAVLASWPYDGMRRADGHGRLRLRNETAPMLARLEVEDPAAVRAVLARCRALDAGERRQTGRIVGWSLAAVCSILVMAIYGIPYAADRLAPLVPYAVEARLGEAVDGQIRAILGGETCETPAGRAALDKLIGTLAVAGGATDAMREALRGAVLASDMPNAIALPGGRIYLFAGLLDKAEAPDEIAGVVAHEIGHAQHRDAMRRLIQTGGTTFVLGLLLGDVTGGGAVIVAARSLLDASYSRDTERRADDYAVAAMTALGRSPVGMGELLVRVTGDGRRGTILDSHPMSAERLDRMKGAAGAVAGPPILTDAEWRALKDICEKAGG